MLQLIRKGISLKVPTKKSYHQIFILSFYSCSKTLGPTMCEAGTYMKADRSACVPCGKGFHCPTTMLESPLPCPLGEYSDTDNATSCSPCPAGTYCNITNATSPITCDDGTYSTGGLSGCLNCPAGHR